MFQLRDLPTYEAIRARAERFPEVDPEGMYAFLVLQRVAMDVSTSMEKYFARYRLSHGSFSVLMLLYRDTGIGRHPSDLAARCGVTRATMTGLLDGLQRKKLVRREKNQKDRRTILVRLNTGGIELLESMLPDFYGRIALLMSDISAKDKKRMSGMLSKVSKGIPRMHRP